MPPLVATTNEYRFQVTLHPEPEGGFTARVPSLPEIVTHGDDEDDALANAKEAIELVIESRRERGEPIPPSDVVQAHTVSITIPA